MACTNQCYIFSCVNILPNEIFVYSANLQSGLFGGYTPPTDSNDFVIDDLDIISLRQSIDDERLRRGIADYWTTNQKNTGTAGIEGGPLDDAIINDLISGLNGIRNSFIATVTIGTKQRATKIKSIKDKINSYRAECILYNVCGPNTVCACYGNCTCITY